jgi:beta-mannosidase
VSQVLQAEGIKIGAEHLRRIKPHNMGSLYWQINDCWPVASWSSIDYTGRWKALQYYARRFYSDILVSPMAKDGNIEIFIVSDRLQPATAQLRVSVLDFNGNALWGLQQQVAVAALASKSYLTVPSNAVLKGRDLKTVFLLIELVMNGNTVASNEYFFEPYKNLALPRPQVAAEVDPTRGGFKLTLSSDKLARALYLSAPGLKGSFADNYFNLIPGRRVDVEFRASERISLNEFRSRLKIRTLADAF